MDIIVIKIGGLSTEKLTPKFFDTLKYWQTLNKKIVVVHGGGSYITDMLEELNIKSQTCNGLRVTDSKVLDVTKLVLIGKVLPELTALFNKNGCKAIGVNAADISCIKGEQIDMEKYGYVGEVTEVNKTYFYGLLEKNVIPIVSPLCLDSKDNWLNVNADATACMLAGELHAEKLYLMTDVPGIKYADRWLQSISPSEINSLINKKVIKEGMIPKVRNGLNAFEKGVKMVMITKSLNEVGTQITI